MDLVKVVVQFKNDIGELKPEQYISAVQVGAPSSCIHTLESCRVMPLIPLLLGSLRAVCWDGATTSDPERG